jgi:hypothetical protein
MKKSWLLIGLLAAFATVSAWAQSDGGMTEVATFEATLSPSSENPPVTGVNLSGDATVSVHTTRDSAGVLTEAMVDFDIDLENETPLTLTAMHIHRAPQGENGPVVIDSEFGTALDLDAGSRNLFRQVTVTSMEGLEAIQDLLDTPGDFYLNVHSMANPDGVIRGQLRAEGSDDGTGEPGLGDMLSAEHGELAGKIDVLQENLERIARRLGVVPVTSVDNGGQDDDDQ